MTCGNPLVNQSMGPGEGLAGQGKKDWTDGFWAPFFDFLWKLIWVTALAVFVYRFRAPLALLIAKAELKLNLFGNQVQVHVIPLAQRQAKEEEEVRDEGGADKAMDLRPASGGQLGFKSYMAEDLALRMLQLEFKTPIQRQVTAGRDPGFDGLFELNNKVIVVEVRYYKATFAPSRLQAAIRNVVLSLKQYRWKGAEVILVAVFEHIEEAERARKFANLQRAVLAVSADIPIQVRMHTMAELEALLIPSPEGK